MTTTLADNPAPPLSRIAPPSVPNDSRAGLFYALGAYLAWGFVPTYFKLLTHVHPVLVLSHRIVWSVVFLSLILTLQGKWDEVLLAVRNRKRLVALLCSTIFIAINWYAFIWAIVHDHVLQASLGYFMNPLVNVLLGGVVLGERPRPGQIAGILLATAGVIVLTVTTGGVPWVSLSLAFSFSLYGLIRKTVPVGALAGLSVETGILFPISLALAMGLVPTPPHAVFTGNTYVLLASAGVVTAIPLLLFAAGARRLRFSTLGFLQYLAPTCQFFLAVLVYQEPFSSRQLISFALIWSGLAAYTLETVLNFRATRNAPT